MLIAFYGADSERARAEVRAYIEKDGRAPERITTTDWYAGRCLEVAQTMPLFDGAKLYVLDTPSDNEDYAKEVYSSLDGLAESPHTFVLLESTLLVAKSRPLQTHAKEVFEFRKTEKKEIFNTFALADALAARDKRSLWLTLHKAWRAGESSEAIIGILGWQLRALALALRTKTAAEADMKDFPYNKAKHSLAKFKDGDIEHLTRTLTAVYHEGHGGKRDIQDALEEWVLSV